jgi:hypothetical protein
VEREGEEVGRDGGGRGGVVAERWRRADGVGEVRRRRDGEEVGLRNGGDAGEGEQKRKKSRRRLKRRVGKSVSMRIRRSMRR